jgi:hypothetical protein
VRPKEASLLALDSGHTTESSVNKVRGTVSGVLQEISFFFRDEFDEQLTRLTVLSSCSGLDESFMDILTLFDEGSMLSISSGKQNKTYSISNDSIFDYELSLS